MTREDPKYTVAVCNYNMARTLEESLRSILDQIDERFEVLVVDDGSTDGSQEILDRLEEEYEALRWIEGENENIGEARAQANRQARGEYVILQLDADDRIKPVLKDLVEVYHKIEEEREGMFWMWDMAPKELLQKVNFRSIGRAEDRDFKRRLWAEDALIPVERNSMSEELGYKYDKIDVMRNSYFIAKNVLRSGVTYGSFLKWKIENLKNRAELFQILTSPIALLHATIEGRYEMPEEYRRYGQRWEDVEENMKTLRDLEEKYDFKIKDKLSEEGKEIFYL